MWYRFEEGNPVGIPRIKEYAVAFYDMTKDGKCFDETFFKPDEIDDAITYVETIEDIGSSYKCRVFAYFDDGDIYELKLEKMKGKRTKW